MIWNLVQLSATLVAVALIIYYGRKAMGQLEDLATALDAETNAIAARIDKIIAGQTNPATIVQLQAISDRLKTLGQDPAAPIPPPVPAPNP